MDLSDSPLSSISIMPVAGIPEVRSGDDISDLIVEHFVLRELDVVVVTQKIVSKSEGRVVHIDESDDAGFLDLVEKESKRTLRRRGTLRITETHHGFVCANAGIDRSNTEIGTVTLLPKDPDRSAHRIRQGIFRKTGINIAVIVTDTFGRTWRNGVTDVAIGISGLGAIADLRGLHDANGRELKATEICIADEIAAAADLVKPKSRQIPVVVVRGLDSIHFRESSVKSEVIRNPKQDLFR